MKYLENGEYLQTTEVSTEQNYNMIDGRRNNMEPQKKSKTKQRKRIFARQNEREKGAFACELKKGCTGKEF